MSTASSAPGVTLVTGGGTGIGAAVARRMAEQGDRVVVCGRRREPLERVAGAHELITARTADVASGAEMAELVAGILEEHGRLDRVVANAGGHGFATVGETDDDAWRSSIDGNLTTAFATARAALPALVESRGGIVFVSSLAGVRAGPETAGYTVGKHAVIGLMRSVARDYGHRGVRANAVCPGWVRTPMADEEMALLVEEGKAEDVEAAYARVTRDVPLQRAAASEDIAGTVAFLLGPDAAYVHGATLVADGGAHIVDVPTLAFG